MDGNKGLWLTDRTTGSSKFVPLSGFAWLFGIDWSRRLNLILVLVSEQGNDRTSIYTVRPDGTQFHKVVEERDIRAARWSADGNAIYYIRDAGSVLELAKLHITDSRSGPAISFAIVAWPPRRHGLARIQIFFGVPSAAPRRRTFSCR